VHRIGAFERSYAAGGDFAGDLTWIDGSATGFTQVWLKIE
jgi:hypothetical protein